MICGWDLPPPLHTTEQGWAGALTALWYNTYTKKALYCIEFRKGGEKAGPSIHVCVCVCVCVCVTASSLKAKRRG
jgi:hypothetical protein